MVIIIVGGIILGYLVMGNCYIVMFLVMIKSNDSIDVNIGLCIKKWENIKLYFYWVDWMV